MPISHDQPAKFGQPRPQQHACERQGRGEDRGNMLLTNGLSCKDILMALLMLELFISLSDPHIIMKATHKLQDFGSEVYNSLKKMKIFADLLSVYKLHYNMLLVCKKQITNESVITLLYKRNHRSHYPFMISMNPIP